MPAFIRSRCTVPGTAASATSYCPSRFTSFHLACPSALLREKKGGGACASLLRLLRLSAVVVVCVRGSINRSVSQSVSRWIDRSIGLIG